MCICFKTAPCPAGYTYVDCFDSCYKWVATAVKYLDATQDCYNDGAHLWAINSEDELKMIKNDFFPSDSDVWIGLQNWARRGVGKNRADWVFSSENPDPDGVWVWPDGDSTVIKEANFNNTSSGAVNVADPHVDWLIFTKKLDDHFFTHLTGFKVTMKDDFQTSSLPYLCEYSNACHICPTGYEKFNQHCFKITTSPTDYNTAVAKCTSEGSFLWTPRTEALALYSKFTTDSTMPAMDLWLGLAHNEVSGGEKWIWADGVETSSSDCFMLGNAPRNSDRAIFIQPEDNSLIQDATPQDPNSVMWDGDSKSASHAFVCQFSAVLITTTTAATTTPGSTTTGTLPTTVETTTVDLTTTTTSDTTTYSETTTSVPITTTPTTSDSSTLTTPGSISTSTGTNTVSDVTTTTGSLSSTATETATTVVPSVTTTDSAATSTGSQDSSAVNTTSSQQQSSTQTSDSTTNSIETTVLVTTGSPPPAPAPVSSSSSTSSTPVAPAPAPSPGSPSGSPSASLSPGSTAPTPAPAPGSSSVSPSPGSPASGSSPTGSNSYESSADDTGTNEADGSQKQTNEKRKIPIRKFLTFKTLVLDYFIQFHNAIDERAEFITGVTLGGIGSLALVIGVGRCLVRQSSNSVKPIDPEITQGNGEHEPRRTLEQRQNSAKQLDDEPDKGEEKIEENHDKKEDEEKENDKANEKSEEKETENEQKNDDDKGQQDSEEGDKGDKLEEDEKVDEKGEEQREDSNENKEEAKQESEEQEEQEKQEENVDAEEDEDDDDLPRPCRWMLMELTGHDVINPL